MSINIWLASPNMFVQPSKEKKHELRNDATLHNREAPSINMAMYKNINACVQEETMDCAMSLLHTIEELLQYI